MHINLKKDKPLIDFLRKLDLGLLLYNSLSNVYTFSFELNSTKY